MSLRTQISLRILLFSVCIFFLGGSIAIWQARNAVKEEVASTINLAIQLIRLGFTPGSQVNTDATDWLHRLAALEQTRHLHIQLKNNNGQVLKTKQGSRKVGQRENSPPQWFVQLVSGDYPEVEYRLDENDENSLILLIQPNPLDEITEVWDETRAFFLILAVFLLLTFLAVHLTLYKSLKAIDTIVDALQSIERGEYTQKLPTFATLEYDSIARAIDHLSNELDKARQQNRSLTEHSLTIQEEERQHLSQELHDEFGQSLTAIKVMAISAAHETADTKKITQSIVDICDHLMGVVRSMMQQLHPLILTELGLKATLEELMGRWMERNPEMLLTLECDDAVDGLEKKLIIQLFRVIQECLTNIIRHAQATQVNIRLEIQENPDRLMLLVTDNGKGCDLETIQTGFGLRGMQERIKSLGGEFSVQSQPGQGMSVKAEIVIT